MISIKQTKNAEDAIEALKEYEPELAKVHRANQPEVQWIKASELVPGDIIEVSVGDRVPADTRIFKIFSTSLKVDQAILTGESLSVLKTADPIKKQKTIVNQDKINILFSGTNIVSGKAMGVVIGTGSNTEIGRIWDQLTQTDNTRTPLQLKLDEFGDQLSKVISVICILVWVINFNHFCDPIHGGSWIRGAVYYFKIAVALAVAAIPEGLPAVITTCLAIGTKRMAKKNAIVRSLPSVETLGSTSVICSDKTGTLTTNQMSIMKAFIVGNDSKNSLIHFNATGTSYDPRDGAVFTNNQKSINFNDYPALEELSFVNVLCNDATLSYNKKKDLVERIGEATEAALLSFTEKLNFFKLKTSATNFVSVVSEHIKSLFVKEITLEFSRNRKSMSVLCKNLKTNKKIMFVKGAPENIINRCSFIRKGNETVKMTEDFRTKLIQAAITYGTGEDTLRCIGLAVVDNPKDIKPSDLENFSKFIEYEKDMTFIGVVGMIDPPRIQVSDAIKSCKSAGIRVIVITGDNKETAIAICRKIGVFGLNEDIKGLAFSAAEFDELSESEQRKVCKKARLFARVEPSHKSKIVSYLQADGEITAMTGDGVNDAPALKKAEIGVAMGSGTSVAKSASDLILADDDFSTIVEAVKEGRAIYRNTIQFISYLVSSNIGEVISIFLTSMLGIPEGLIPVQLLWVNLITDGLPATALGFNPSDPDIMSRPPRNHKDSLISLWQLFRYSVIGFYVGIATVLANIWWYLYDIDGPHLTLKHLINHQQCSPTNAFYAGIDCELFNNYYPMTMALSVLVVSEMLNAYNSISEFQSILVLPPWKNVFLMIATVISLIIHVFTTYFPLTQRIFQVTALSYEQWKIVIMLSIPVIFIDELMKLYYRTYVDNHCN